MHVCLLALAVLAEPLPETFPFALTPLDSSPTLIDLSRLSPEPAGQGGRLTVKDGHFVDGAGRRVKLFGTNLTFQGAFPDDRAQADAIAARLRKFGFNAVRLHHLDTAPAPRGLWADRDLTTIDPAQLDKLDALIAALKQHGIWVNLNLHVGRNYPGIDYNRIPRTFRYGKVIDHFVPRLIELQKEYATALLTHRNPYTGTTYAEEPAIAILELNNENALTAAAWNSDLLALPEDLLKPLLDGWQAWLKAHYGTVAEAVAAWSAGQEPLGDNLLRNGDFAAGAGEWQLQAPAPAQATMTVAPGAGPNGQAALRCQMTQPGDQSWHFQTHQVNLDLSEGRTYTVTFQARSDAPREMRVYAMLQEADWHNVGLMATVKLTTDWRRYRYQFVTSRVVPGKSRLSFSYLNQPGTFELAEVQLRPGAGIDLPPNAGFAQLEPPINTGLPAQRADWVRYLMAVEDDYVSGLRRHLTGLGARALVISTQDSYGGTAGLRREARHSDYIDMHAYWEHPHFPNRPWDAKDWRIPNTPMIASDKGGTLFRLASERVAGKPFVISEYNHPAPSLYNSEMFPVLAAYAAYQDWDGIFQFTFANSADDHRSDRLRSYFTLASHPGQMVFAPLASLLFRSGLVPPAPEATELLLPLDAIADLAGAGRTTIESVWDLAGARLELFAQRRVAVRPVTGGGQPRLDGAPGEAARDGWLTADGAPFQWRPTPAETAELKVVAEQAVAIIGRIGGRTVSAGPLSIALEPTGRNFASVLLVSLDDQPIGRSRRLALAVAGAVVNPNMGWNETFTSVGNQWGDGPTRAEALRATVRLTTSVPLTVQALDGAGAPGAKVPASAAGGLTFKIDPAQATLWYGLTAP